LFVYRTPANCTPLLLLLLLLLLESYHYTPAAPLPHQPLPSPAYR
jgi:hypothetical protein